MIRPVTTLTSTRLVIAMKPMKYAAHKLDSSIALPLRSGHASSVISLKWLYQLLPREPNAASKSGLSERPSSLVQISAPKYIVTTSTMKTHRMVRTCEIKALNSATSSLENPNKRTTRASLNMRRYRKTPVFSKDARAESPMITSDVAIDTIPTTSIAASKQLIGERSQARRPYAELREPSSTANSSVKKHSTRSTARETVDFLPYRKRTSVSSPQSIAFIAMTTAKKTTASGDSIHGSLS
mmetsp:Transcript_49906/g.139700  ORF Transcript_49906/g.139700 Transcript_49906/m.139700 type:complete len:241 (+) Transcript_49906:1972-2694(+)